MTTTALVYGMAISGEAVARALHDRGVRLLVADDAANDARSAAAAAVGADLIARPDAGTLDTLVARATSSARLPAFPKRIP